MKTKLIEQRKVLRLSCYKEEKFAPPPGVDDPTRRRLEELQKCPWGYTEIQTRCKNCRWFRVTKVPAVRGVPMQMDREVSGENLPVILREYGQQQALDFADEIGGD